MFGIFSVKRKSSPGHCFKKSWKFNLWA